MNTLTKRPISVNAARWLCPWEYAKSALESGIGAPLLLIIDGRETGYLVYQSVEAGKVAEYILERTNDVPETTRIDMTFGGGMKYASCSCRKQSRQCEHVKGLAAALKAIGVEE